MIRWLRIVAQVAGLLAGVHRAQTRWAPGPVLALATGGITVLAGGIVFAVVHLAVTKEVAR